MKFLNEIDGASKVIQDANNRFVTDSEKSTWNGKQNAITGGASTITSSNLTTNRALISDSSGKVTASSVTSTELGYVSGVTSSIQTQLNGKASTSHSHAISDVSGLQTALDGKSASNHNHTLDGLSNTTITSNTNGEILRWNGSAWVNNTLAEAGIASASHNHDISTTTGLLSSDRLSEPSYLVANVTNTARPLFDVLRGDKTAFLPETQIIIEQSTDAGVTWVDAGVDDATKRRLFTGQRPSIRIPLKNGIQSTDCMIRITITAMRYNVPLNTPEIEKYGFWNSANVLSTERYCTLNEGWIWLTSLANRIHMKVEKASGSSSGNWSLDREAFMSGWSGGNYFSLSGSNFGGGTTQTGNYWNWRFTFRTCSPSQTFNDSDLSTTYNTSQQTISHIKTGGKNMWVAANNYMNNEHIYSWDENQAVVFPNNITAKRFISNVPTGTAPLQVSSTTVVPNLNASMVSGFTVGTNVPANAVFTDTVYTHPANHPPSIITQDANNRFVTDAEKATWNAKGSSNLALGTTSTTAYRGDYGNTAYTHSQSAHAPSNAQANQTLTSGNGMATWTATNGNLTITLGTPSTITSATTNSVTATSHTHALTLTKADITALGIPAQDTVYTHPATHPPSIIAQDASNRFVTDAEKSSWNAKLDITLGTVQPSSGWWFEVIG